MRLKAVITSLIILAALFASGQKRLLYQVSGETINKGEKATSKGDFETAATYFERVPPSDTNYLFAQTKLANTYYELQKYDQAISLIQRLDKNNKTTSPERFMVLARSFQALEKNNLALESFNKGIQKFPMNHLLFYHRSLLFQKLGEDQKAIEGLQQTLQRNVFFDLAHLKLAEYAREKGEISKAMMAYNLYLILVPNSDLETLIEYNTYLDAPSHGSGVSWGISSEDFSNTDEKIRSQGSKSKKFKTPNKLTIPIVKQNYLLFSELDKLSVDENGFWNRFYVPFYKEILKDKKFNDLMYYMLRMINNKNVTPVLKKNASIIDAFSDYAGPLWQKIHNYQYVLFNGELQEVYYYWGPNLGVAGRGVVLDSEPTGTFEYYHENGDLKAIGEFTEDGEREGKWVYYYKNGGISEIKHFEGDDPIDTDSVFFKNGQIESLREYKNNRSTVVTSYFRTGQIKSKLHYSEEQLNGEAIYYYATGGVDYKTHFYNDQLNGTYKSYYANGSLKKSLSFQDGMKAGEENQYYRNGATKATYTYYEGNLQGTTKEWYENKNLLKEVYYENGNIKGPIREYYPNKTLMSETTMEEKKSKMTYYSQYDEDGKLNLKLTYKQDELISYEVFDSNGTILEAQQKLSGSFIFNDYYTNGAKKTTGIYAPHAGGKTGDWKEFNKIGILQSTTSYLNGEISGDQFIYYTSGKTKILTPFKNQKINGLVKGFHPNGQLREQGYSINGAAEGEWIQYYQNGTISKESFYVLGQLNGTQKHFAINGKLDYTQTYNNNILLSYTMFDTNGIAIHSANISDQTTAYEYRYPSGDLLREFQFIGNVYHGLSTSYYPTGQVKAQGYYLNNNLDSAWKWFYPNGQLKKEGSYLGGSKVDEWNSFYENGTIKSQENFENGLNEGLYRQYYKNGQPETEISYYRGQKHGVCKYWSINGELQQIRTYKYGVWTGYSYNGKDGKLVETIPVIKETLQCTSYYSNGSKSKEFAMVNGDFEGKYIDYYANGQIQSQVSFKSNMMQGKHLTYYKNGILKSEIPYTDDSKHGVAKYYSSQGELIRLETYFMGSLHGKTIDYLIQKPPLTKFFYNNDLITK